MILDVGSLILAGTSMSRFRMCATRAGSWKGNIANVSETVFEIPLLPVLCPEERFSCLYVCSHNVCHYSTKLFFLLINSNICFRTLLLLCFSLFTTSYLNLATPWCWLLLLVILHHEQLPSRMCPCRVMTDVSTANQKVPKSEVCVFQAEPRPTYT